LGWWFTTRDKKNLLLLVIFAFSFLFRAAVIFHNPYPPSSDIGFHGSIINLMLEKGELPNWNPYHMGGETLATPPGFHFFVTTLILLSGMDLILAELITAAFYSSVIVFLAYLVSKKIWNNSNAGLLAAFFATVSMLSIEMINWGGYTNIVSLSLIVTIFYLFFKYANKPKLSYLLVGALLFGSLIITHTFSLFVVFPILGFYLVLLLVGKWKKKEDMQVKSLLRFFVVSVGAGVVTASPWILRVFSFYVGASSEGAATGGLDNRNIILANRTVDNVILLLVIVVIPALFMFKASRKKMFDKQSLLLIAWFLVPIVMTQAYLFGVIIDYSRFMYFFDFPLIIIISAGLLYLFQYTAIAIKKTPRIKWNRIKKTLPITTFSAIIFIFTILSIGSIFPIDALQRANFYTTMYEPENATLEWIRNNTPEESVLVAEHTYGWWLGGIGERPTLSAAGLEFLIYSHELEVARAAQVILDKNFLYYFDNSLIQVRENDGNVLGKGIEFSIELLNGESFPIFNIQEEEMEFWYLIYTQGKEITGNITVAEMERIGTPIIIKEENSVTLIVQYEDELFTINRTLTVKQGEIFAELSYDIGIKNSQTNLYNIWFPIYVREGVLTKDEEAFNPYGLYPGFGFYYKNQLFGQVIFQEDLPGEIDYIDDEPKKVQMLFRYPKNRTVNIKMLIGVCNGQDLSYEEAHTKYLEFLANPQKTETDNPLFFWDYKEIIEKYKVSFVVCRNQEAYLKFSEDPNFRFIFNSGNVAIFQVVK